MLAFVEGDRLARVEGNPEHPYTRGSLCRKVAHYEERVYSRDRLLSPMRRVGPKGAGEFERISWEAALDEIAARWKRIIAQYGAEAILPYSYAGTMGVVNMHACEGRLWYRLGASNLARTICSSAGEAGYTYTMGWSGGMDPEAFALSKFIIAWGTNLSSTNVHLMPFIREAQKRGATFVVIDPYRTRTAQCADWFVQVRPGTDTALALGMMNVLFAEGLHDESYLERYTIGWRELRERAGEYPPERTAEITGIPAREIAELARRYAAEQPSAIRMGYGMTRNSNGGMMARTLTCLPAVIGAWGRPGGGLLLSTSSHFRWNKAAVKRPDLLPSPFKGERPGVRAVPRTVNMNELGRALTEPADPPVMSLMVWNSNPAGVAPDSNRVLRGLEREDLFTIVHEQMMTDTARYADILLPATTQMEHLDLHFAYGHLYVQLNQPAIPPRGEARPNIEVHHALAKRMGFPESCWDETAEDIIRLALDTEDPRMAGITYEYLHEHGFARLRPDPVSGFTKSPIQNPKSKTQNPLVAFSDGKGFLTPSGKIELFSEQAVRDGFDPLPQYEPLAESLQGDPALAERYPINLLTPAAHHFLNTTFANLPSLQKAEKEPRVWIHPQDAKERGISEGDWARVWNDRGEVRLRAVLSENVRPGVAWSPSLWWHWDSPEGGNVNALTSDRLTDMGGGSTFHTNLVQIARLDTER
jgi:anaerobic selenocysteine-containing dehydrogenase